MPETQYRLLNNGEIVQRGDEWVWQSASNCFYWIQCLDIGNIVGKTLVRRKIEPVTGYRLLEVGEEIKEGDEVYHQNGLVPNHWFPVGLFGDTVTKGHLPIRRKIG